MSPEPDVTAALTAAARQEGGRLVALLAGRFGDLDLADEAVQDALAEAWLSWPDHGVPANPAAWLHTVARRKALDRLRRSAVRDRQLRAAAPDLLLRETDDPPGPAWTRDQLGVADDQLRLLLLCCHPALHVDAQVALTLRLVAGLTTPEIAAAYLVPEATMAQRIVRAKAKIRAARIPLTIPTRLDERVTAVLRTLYLIFNEGYLGRADAAGGLRVDLMDEAVRLTNLSVALLPDAPEVKGLLALELYHRARAATRVDAAGSIVTLEEQDRSRWDLSLITTANKVLADIARSTPAPPGPYVLQAMIAGYHANARTAADTNWPAVVTAYDVLLATAPSPVVALNRAVAVAMSDGPRLGLQLLDGIAGLERYHLFHAARADLLRRCGDLPAALAAYEEALLLVSNPAERLHLQRERAMIMV